MKLGNGDYSKSFLVIDFVQNFPYNLLPKSTPITSYSNLILSHVLDEYS